MVAGTTTTVGFDDAADEDAGMAVKLGSTVPKDEVPDEIGAGSTAIGDGMGPAEEADFACEGNAAKDD